ncbi:MAG: hypothetical protein R3C41_23450 [Calditrichia bacterium]
MFGTAAIYDSSVAQFVSTAMKIIGAPMKNSSTLAEACTIPTKYHAASKE